MVSLKTTFLALSIFTLSNSYAEVKVGDKLSSFRLPDQHKKEHVVDTNVRIIIFARDMDGNKIVRAALEGKAKGYLEKRKAVYISDISQMPKMITKMLAMPKMKKYSYSVLLDSEAKLTKDLPYKEDHTSLIYLNELKVEKIIFIGDAKELRGVLGN